MINNAMYGLYDATTVTTPTILLSAATDTTSSSAYFFSPPWSEFELNLDEVQKEMRRFQGFRGTNVYWFNRLKTAKARKLSIICLRAIREEQRKDIPKDTREHKKIMKPRTGSLRSWMTGTPRR